MGLIWIILLNKPQPAAPGSDPGGGGGEVQGIQRERLDRPAPALSGQRVGSGAQPRAGFHLGFGPLLAPVTHGVLLGF